MADNQSVIDRLKLFIKSKGIGQTKFEEVCNLGRGWVSKIKGSPKDEKLLNIIQQFPDLNTVWLLTGEGEMLKRRAVDPAPPYEETQHKEKGNAVSDDGEGYMIPLISAEATAGGLPMVDNIGETIANMGSIQCPVKADLAMCVTGESMEPEYKDGSIVLLRRVDASLFIEWGHVYVLDTTNGAVMKEVHKASDDDKVLCVSLNKDAKYAPYEIPRSCIRNWFRVVYGMGAK